MATTQRSFRQASPKEYEGMVFWVRWAYDHNLPVVYYPLDDVITVIPTGKSLDGLDVQFLQKGNGSEQSVQSGAGQAAPGD